MDAELERLLAQTEPASDEDIAKMKAAFRPQFDELIKDVRMQDWLRRNKARVKQLAEEGKL